MITCSQLDHLYRYPDVMWAKPDSARWAFLCDALRQYDAPAGRLVLARERKWELVSALQKSIRRGDKQVALHLLFAIDSMPEEYAYFWRRLCVIACEDVGPADDVLTSFVVACSTVFPPRKTGCDNLRLMGFLAEQMCDLPTRSRIYCSYSVIELAVTKSELPELLVQDRPIVSAVMQRKAAVQNANDPWQQWLKKNDWRAEKMVKFVGLTLPMEMTRAQAPVPPHTILFDLPSCSFDMHTRVGLAMLKRLVQGVPGAEGIKELFREHKIKAAHRAVGDALFFVEGCRIEGEQLYEELCCLEQRIIARQYGLPMNVWLELRVLVENALADGVIDGVREEVLDQFYGRDWKSIA
jgi:hypothetical protein